MRSIFKKISFVPILLLLVSSVSLAQKSPHQSLINGIDAFYEARFEDAVKILEQAIETDSLSQNELFSAHIYIAFSLIRQNIGQDMAQRHLEEAVRVLPTAILDDKLIPPDLYQRFQAVRQSLLGSLTVETIPPGASAILVDQTHGRVIGKSTPAFFNGLVSGDYSLVLSKDGYKEQNLTVTVTPGKTDSLSILLEQKKSFFTRWWAWGAGLAIAAAVVVSDVVSGGEPAKEKSQELPEPPKRP